MNAEKLLEPKLKDIPKVPDEFGEDGGHFYRYYDDIADELDEDMVSSLKAQLDGILIFTGLFAGINTAFLAFTLPEMSADPADDTNALLLQLVIGGNGTIRSADDLPSAAFSPSLGVFPVNLLFSLSLTLAIITAFLAVLGQQWLIYYRKRSGGGIEYQRWEQLQRHLGARHWRLEVILDDILPALLQLGLVIFCVAFILYLRTLSKTMCYVIASPLALALAILLITSVIAVLDKWCPFKSTLSHFLQLLDEISTKYKPIRYLVAPLVFIPCFLPLYTVITIISVIAGFWMGLRIYIGVFRGEVPDLLRGDRGPLDGILRESNRVSASIIRQLTTSLVPRGKAIAFLRAAAVRRVICTSEDFNALVYTAINIQAMRGKEGAKYLLKDDTVHERFKELIKSSEKALVSAFSCAFAHLLLGGQSAELFVEREERHLYRPRTPFPRLDQYYSEPHPLKETVGFICDQLKTCVESPDIRPDNFVETVFYFELLELLLDEKSSSQELSKWLDRVIQQQQPSKVSTLLVISLVADTVRILNRGIESAGAPSGLRIDFGSPSPEQEGQDGLNQERERDRFFTVQQQRVEAVKKLISAVGWEMHDRESALGLIEEALSIDNSEPSRRPTKAEIWLLEQALLLSTPNRHERGWQFIASSSVGLLRSFDSSEDTTPDSASPPNSLQADRLRCANVLSQCLQSMRDHLKPDGFIQAVSPALNKLVDYWAQFKDDSSQNPDLTDAAMLPTWLEIRASLDRPEELGWGPGHQQQFGEAYPSLKLGFDAIASAAQGAETVPGGDRNSPKLPRIGASDTQIGPSEPGTVVAHRAQSEEDVHIPPEDTGESQEHEGAREPNSKQQGE
ncbi:hypothetical protein FRC00_005623 [Tulasnella sp. 408]|nr:hypothetical protein FRC00_005623 [Tulasnella sp. 408]